MIRTKRYIRKHSQKHIDWKFIISNTILVILAILLYGGALWASDDIHVDANHDEREELGIRRETIGLISSDRIHHGHLKRLPMAVPVQKMANRQAKKAYQVIKNQPRDPKYYDHNLSSNGQTNNPYQQTSLSKKLQLRNKAHRTYYDENCTEIGFGKRYYKDNQLHWKPYHNVRTTWSLADLVNNHFMYHDKNKLNEHRNNILSHNVRSMAVSVIYNSKTNHGVLVEEFSHK